MTKPRRDFLGWIGASTMLAATGSPLLAREPVPPPDAPGLTPVSSHWDVTWADRIQGKHRAVFDSPEVSEGSALVRAVMWQDQYREIYGTGAGEMSAVVVIRHHAIPLAMDDAFWARFPIAREEKLKDPEAGKWYTRNPIRAVTPSTPRAYAGYSLEAFMAGGGIVLACDLAFRMVVARFRKADKLDREQAYARARAHLIPGIILQPSGIFAVLRAQQAGCGYIMAS